LPYYRGYKPGGDATELQYYTIYRTSSTSSFIVDGSGSYSALSQQLTSNMYLDQGFTVNNLINSDGITCANLGITGAFNQYSILPGPPDDTVIYPITVTGDSVIVDISNNAGPSVAVDVSSNSTPVENAQGYTAIMTLKDYGRDYMYSFSGQNWDSTGYLMAIRPSRVKLTNSAFTNTTTRYQIKFIDTEMSMYKAIQSSSDISYNWLGNPSEYGSQDENLIPDPNKWMLVEYLTEDMFRDGINIGTKTIYLPSTTTLTLLLAYYVSVPPYYTYEQMSTADCAVIPYNYGIDFSLNQTTRYYPYTGLTDTFNPFAATVSFTDISGNVTNVTNDQDILNDVTFTLQNPPTLTSMFMDPDSIRRSAIVEGTNVSISLYLGDYPSTTPGDGHTNPIYNGPITSIPTTPYTDGVLNSVLFRNRDESGGIHFSVLQYPEDIGFPAGAEGYEIILRTNNPYEWFNIDFTMGNPSWYNDNNPVTYFNLNASGISPTLYTVVDMNNPITQQNKRRVYKYTTLASIDTDLSGGPLSGVQTITLPFNARQYCDIDISGGTFGTSGIWNYPDILKDTNIGDTTITWQTDASFAGFVYAGWSFGNSTTAQNMLIDLLSVQDTQQKWTYITLEPFYAFKNQFGITVSGIAWDGSITAPLINTRVVKLYPSIQTPILQNNNTAIEQYSTSTLN